MSMGSRLQDFYSNIQNNCCIYSYLSLSKYFWVPENGGTLYNMCFIAQCLFISFIINIYSSLLLFSNGNEQLIADMLGLLMTTRTLTGERILFMKIDEATAYGKVWGAPSPSVSLQIIHRVHVAVVQERGIHRHFVYCSEPYEVMHGDRHRTFGWRLGCSSTYPLGSMAK